MWTHSFVVELYLSLPADQPNLIFTDRICIIETTMDKSVFARVLKVIIQCVEEGSALLQTFKMEGDTSNTRITIEFQSHEAQAGTATKSEHGSGPSDDNSPKKFQNKPKDKYSPTSRLPADAQTGGGPATGSGGGGGSASNYGRHKSDNPPNDKATLTNGVTVKDGNRQNLHERLQRSLAELHRTNQRDAGKESPERKSKARHRGVDIVQVIRDQNRIQPMTDDDVDSELQAAVRHLECDARKRHKGKKPFLKCRSLDELDQPQAAVNGRLSEADDPLSNLANNKDERTAHDTRPKTVMFTIPQAVEALAGNIGTSRSHDRDDYHDTESSHGDSESDESLESVTDIRKFNMNQRKKHMKKRKSVIAL